MLKYLFVFLFTSLSLSAQISLDYYLPEDMAYDSNIPTPQSFLGYDVGAYHISHDLLVNYLRLLSASSERVTLREYARSYEEKPLVLLTITSVENQGRIQEIKKQHSQLADPSVSSDLPLSDMPSVVWLGHSIHGNEASGGNASVLLAYHLIAAKGAEHKEMLNNTVILLDPCYNPDGFNRFASWVNTHKSLTLVSDPASREYHEAYPRGRTNHYWFDLNRDWMPVQHPESQGRIRMFQEWLPNILTDQHEMGTYATYFFQPGVPARTNPLTPQTNQELTGKIATYHGKALDNIKSLYYTKEGYDDFYYGKGSSYPDINGSIGILFEQASARGHIQETPSGTLTFPFAIRNQLTTSLSTLTAAQDMREELLAYQRDFFKTKRSNDAYVVGIRNDPARLFHFAELLSNHSIAFYELPETVNQDGKSFEPGSAYVIPLNQQRGRLVEGIFQQTTDFKDSIFYDVSAWTMPLAFGLDYMKGRVDLGEKVKDLSFPVGDIKGGKSSLAYLFKWSHYYAPRAAYRLIEKGIRIKVSRTSLTTTVNGESEYFPVGSIMVHLGIQDLNEDELFNAMQEITEKDGINVFAVEKGLVDQGYDLGTRQMEVVKKPKVMLLAGNGIRSYDVGEVWHLLDRRYEIPVSMIDKNRIAEVNLDRYNVMVMVDGRYSDIPAQKILDWVTNGGTLVAMKNANKWVANVGLAKLEFKKRFSYDSMANDLPYLLERKYKGAQEIGGAIFNMNLDLTHPVSYGYNKASIPVFRNHEIFMRRGNDPFGNPGNYPRNPLLSGYVSEENLESLSESTAIRVSRFGKGTVVSLIDNPNFRAFWYGTNKLFANSIFFGSMMD